MKIVTVNPPPPEPVRRIEFSIPIPKLSSVLLFLAFFGYVAYHQVGFNPIQWVIPHFPTPTPPTPPAPPAPPVASKVVRVLVLTDLRGVKPTTAQQATLAGAALWQKLESVCPTEGVGEAWSPEARKAADPTRRAWRYWDKGTDASAESAAWQQAMVQATALLASKNVAYPAIVIFTDADPIAATVPATDADALALFNNLQPGA